MNITLNEIAPKDEYPRLFQCGTTGNICILSKKDGPLNATNLNTGERTSFTIRSTDVELRNITLDT